MVGGGKRLSIAGIKRYQEPRTIEKYGKLYLVREEEKK